MANSVRRISRAAVGLALVAAGALLMLFNDRVRLVEALLAGVVSDPVTPGSTYVAAIAPTFFWNAASADMRGLFVTPECTVAFLLGPLLVLGGLLLVSGRFAIPRLLTATAIAGGLLVAANTARLVLIAWATAKWGVADGYQWSHTVGGSIVVGIGVACAMVAFVLMLVAHKRAPRRTRARHGGAPLLEKTAAL